MNLLLVISGLSLIVLAWTLVATSRLRRRRVRVRFRTSSPAPIAAQAEPHPIAVEEPMPEQLSLFENLQPESLGEAPVKAAKEPRAAVNLAPDHSRRSQTVAGPRLDWQYFSKDAGDLGDPASPVRMRPAPAVTIEEQPARRA